MVVCLPSEGPEPSASFQETLENRRQLKMGVEDEQMDCILEDEMEHQRGTQKRTLTCKGVQSKATVMQSVVIVVAVVIIVLTAL